MVYSEWLKRVGRQVLQELQLERCAREMSRVRPAVGVWSVVPGVSFPAQLLLPRSQIRLVSDFF